MITWAKRAAIRRTATGRLRRYRALGQPYAVVELQSQLGLPRRWLAIQRLPNGNELIIGRHRTRRAAERRAEQTARRAVR